MPGSPNMQMRQKATSPSPLPDMACVILAGGQSRRFGSNKAFALWGGDRLVDILLQKLTSQTAGPIGVNAASAADYADLSVPILPDRLTDTMNDKMSGGLGPLAGLHTAMCWAAEAGYSTLITTPVDTPLLPDDFIARLTAGGTPAVASSNERTHPIHGIWPTALHTELAKAIEGGMRAGRDWQAACGAQICDFPVQNQIDPFININHRADLEALEKG